MIKKILPIVLAILPLLAKAQEVKEMTPAVYLIITSYNPDTQRMSDFIMDIESSVIGMDPKADIIIEDLGCKSFSEESFLWEHQMANVLGKFRDSHLKAIILLGQEAWAAFLQQDSIPENVPFFSPFLS